MNDDEHHRRSINGILITQKTTTNGANNDFAHRIDGIKRSARPSGPDHPSVAPFSPYLSNPIFIVIKK